ncbi:CRISPR-associated endonuclease Cas1 [Psychrobacter immobilis]|uniref:CRISPR-associated endonuclease Cas1 n=1 Tax=Psychrobacter immobilis TaxID=498 RepID=UPI00191A5D74|nr:CRISPR-associated endonuclease Cas1 [Psychrobacter immobilis]
MQNIVIDKKGCQLYAERDILMVKHTSLAKTLSIPFSQIQSLTITSQVDLSSHLLTRLAEHHVSVCVLPSGRTGEACFLLGSWHAGIERRKAQYDIVNQDTAKSYWAATLVRLKLHQQASTLNTLQQHRASGFATSALQEPSTTLTATHKIKSLRDKFRKHYYSTTIPATHPSGSAIDTNTPISVYDCYMPQYPVASILGTEGIGSAIYFKCYQSFFAEKWQFNDRNRRPPKDPVNVVLSLSYTLLQHLCQQAIYSIGFDPYHGVLHSPSYGRQSLACDFAELQRGAIDLWVWELFEQEILTLDDFSISDKSSYPCELLKSGRAKYYKAFAAIRARLSKDALSHAWLWQRRLARYHAIDKTQSKKQTLSFVSQLPQV